jgi:small ligand-binding sensory domain FIST
MLCRDMLCQVRDREGAQQDLTSHCMAYKRRELAAMMGSSSSSTLGTSSSSSSNRSNATEQQQQQQPEQDAAKQQQQQQPEPAAAPQPPPQQQQQRRAFGMLLFSCNGRGTSLYNEPSWDSRQLAGFIHVPVSGFMCNGK